MSRHGLGQAYGHGHAGLNSSSTLASGSGTVSTSGSGSGINGLSGLSGISGVGMSSASHLGSAGAGMLASGSLARSRVLNTGGSGTSNNSSTANGAGSTASHQFVSPHIATASAAQAVSLHHAAGTGSVAAAANTSLSSAGDVANGMSAMAAVGTALGGSAGANTYHGGTYTLIFTAQGRDPLENIKVTGSGSINRVFDKSAKGYIVEIPATSPATKLQFPNTERKGLGIMQPFLIFQIRLTEPAGSSVTPTCTMDIVVSDTKRTRRRMLFSTSFKDISVTALHAQLPLGRYIQRSGQWATLCIDLQGFTTSLFRESKFQALDELSISGCHIRRIFTTRRLPASASIALQPGLPSHSTSHFLSPEPISRLVDFTPGVDHVTLVASPYVISPRSGLAPLGSGDEVKGDHVLPSLTGSAITISGPTAAPTKTSGTTRRAATASSITHATGANVVQGRERSGIRRNPPAGPGSTLQSMRTIDRGLGATQHEEKSPSSLASIGFGELFYSGGGSEQEEQPLEAFVTPRQKSVPQGSTAPSTTSTPLSTAASRQQARPRASNLISKPHEQRYPEEGAPSSIVRTSGSMLVNQAPSPAQGPNVGPGLPSPRKRVNVPYGAAWSDDVTLVDLDRATSYLSNSSDGSSQQHQQHQQQPPQLQRPTSTSTTSKQTPRISARPITHAKGQTRHDESNTETDAINMLMKNHSMSDIVASVSKMTETDQQPKPTQSILRPSELQSRFNLNARSRKPPLHTDRKGGSPGDVAAQTAAEVLKNLALLRQRGEYNPELFNASGAAQTAEVSKSVSRDSAGTEESPSPAATTKAISAQPVREESRQARDEVSQSQSLETKSPALVSVVTAGAQDSPLVTPRPQEQVNIGRPPLPAPLSTSLKPTSGRNDVSVSPNALASNPPLAPLTARTAANESQDRDDADTSPGEMNQSYEEGTARLSIPVASRGSLTPAPPKSRAPQRREADLNARLDTISATLASLMRSNLTGAPSHPQLSYPSGAATGVDMPGMPTQHQPGDAIKRNVADNVTIIGPPIASTFIEARNNENSAAPVEPGLEDTQLSSQTSTTPARPSGDRAVRATTPGAGDRTPASPENSSGAPSVAASQHRSAHSPGGTQSVSSSSGAYSGISVSLIADPLAGLATASLAESYAPSLIGWGDYAVNVAAAAAAVTTNPPTADTTGNVKEPASGKQKEADVPSAMETPKQQAEQSTTANAQARDAASKLQPAAKRGALLGLQRPAKIPALKLQIGDRQQQQQPAQSTNLERAQVPPSTQIVVTQEQELIALDMSLSPDSKPAVSSLSIGVPRTNETSAQSQPTLATTALASDQQVAGGGEVSGTLALSARKFTPRVQTERARVSTSKEPEPLDVGENTQRYDGSPNPSADEDSDHDPISGHGLPNATVFRSGSESTPSSPSNARLLALRKPSVDILMYSEGETGANLPSKALLKQLSMPLTLTNISENATNPAAAVEALLQRTLGGKLPEDLTQKLREGAMIASGGTSTPRKMEPDSSGSKSVNPGITTLNIDSPLLTENEQKSPQDSGAKSVPTLPRSLPKPTVAPSAANNFPARVADVLARVESARRRRILKEHAAREHGLVESSDEELLMLDDSHFEDAEDGRSDEDNADHEVEPPADLQENGGNRDLLQTNEALDDVGPIHSYRSNGKQSHLHPWVQSSLPKGLLDATLDSTNLASQSIHSIASPLRVEDLAAVSGTFDNSVASSDLSTLQPQPVAQIGKRILHVNIDDKKQGERSDLDSSQALSDDIHHQAVTAERPEVGSPADFGGNGDSASSATDAASEFYSRNAEGYIRGLTSVSPTLAVSATHQQLSPTHTAAHSFAAITTVSVAPTNAGTTSGSSDIGRIHGVADVAIADINDLGDSQEVDTPTQLAPIENPVTHTHGGESSGNAVMLVTGKQLRTKAVSQASTRKLTPFYDPDRNVNSSPGASIQTVVEPVDASEVTKKSLAKHSISSIDVLTRTDVSLMSSTESVHQLVTTDGYQQQPVSAAPDDYPSTTPSQVRSTQDTLLAAAMDGVIAPKDPGDRQAYPPLREQHLSQPPSPAVPRSYPHEKLELRRRSLVSRGVQQEPMDAIAVRSSSGTYSAASQPAAIGGNVASQLDSVTGTVMTPAFAELRRLRLEQIKKETQEVDQQGHDLTHSITTDNVVVNTAVAGSAQPPGEDMLDTKNGAHVSSSSSNNNHNNSNDDGDNHAFNDSVVAKYEAGDPATTDMPEQTYDHHLDQAEYEANSDADMEAAYLRHHLGEDTEDAERDDQGRLFDPILQKYYDPDTGVYVDP